MKTLRWNILVACIAATTLVVAAGLLSPLGTIDLTAYDDFEHDSGANTLAIVQTKVGGVVTNCTLVLFDKKCQEKVRAVLPEVNGMDNVSISHFEKNWAILRATGDTDIYYSVKISSTPKVLGQQTEFVMDFEYAGKSFVVSYFNGTKSCQVFDTALQPLGAAQTTIGRPRSLSGGAYFYCEDATQTQIWKVKKGAELIVQDIGGFDDINQSKRLCCIRDGDVHKIYAYK